MLPGLACQDTVSGLVQAAAVAVRQIGVNCKVSPAWSWPVRGEILTVAGAMAIGSVQYVVSESPLLAVTVTLNFVVFPPIATGMTTTPWIWVSVAEVIATDRPAENWTVGWVPNPVPVIVNCAVVPAFQSAVMPWRVTDCTSRWMELLQKSLLSWKHALTSMPPPKSGATRSACNVSSETGVREPPAGEFSFQSIFRDWLEPNTKAVRRTVSPRATSVFGEVM